MSPRDIDLVVAGATVATMEASASDPYGRLSDAAVAVRGDRIVAVGRRDDIVRAHPDAPVVNAPLVTPGLVECHSHAVFGGDRRREFDQRAAGATYEDIARAGGGILSTIASTRSASDDELLDGAVRRLQRLADGGATTVEVKSGYGADIETELRMLRVGRGAGERAGVEVVPTLLALHALPPGVDRDVFVSAMCDELIPMVAEQGLAVAVDAFCDDIAFRADEVDRLFRGARAAGLAVKLHADQLSDSGGAALAARHRAVSADHLEHTSAAGVAALAVAGTVAVVLPGATVTLRETARPPIAALRDAGVPIAVSTDANPGSSPLLSLLVAAHLACTVLGLTTAEAFAGITINAARALGMVGDIGRIVVGARADLALWDASHPADLIYWCDGYLPSAVVQLGRLRARPGLDETAAERS